MSRLRPRESVVRQFLDRIFPSPIPMAIEPIDIGGSTFVYRLRRGGETFYLRVLPEKAARLTPEAEAHRLAREQGARVPRVIFVEDGNDLLQASVMITTQMQGEAISLGPPPRDRLRLVVVEAGKDLARINQVPVDGFGWIRRDRHAAGLLGKYRNASAFVWATFEEVLPLLDQLGLTSREQVEVRSVIEKLAENGRSEDAWLVHGDFDCSHIYHEAGRYSGIIDFGEIRGATRWYDLAHFRLHDGERIPFRLLPWLLEGYASINPLPDDLETDLRHWSLLIGARALARSVLRGDKDSQASQHIRLKIKRDLESNGKRADT